MRTLALTVSLGLALAGCAGAPDAAELPAGHAPLPTDAAAASPSAEAAELNVSELAVASGISMAARLGFDKARVISGTELTELKKAPEETLGGVAVLPTRCADVIESLNWSPLQMGGEGARTDFLTEKIAATGSVEVAEITDKSALEAHYATVLAMLTDCKKVTLHQDIDTVPFATSKPDLKAGEADSAIAWTRGTPGQGMRQQALVLIKTKGDHVAMVSFIAEDGLEAPEFSQLAAQVLNAALAQAG
ncbi:hypothetical protein ACIPVK_21055 [Paeniglutamicibacter sp. MACA_103]|uniref:hypothetical protein n=1 Tax=Paeniglutamicibacter sp. MACA_103 TaxID=3377337 RepID=UPI003893FA43